MPYLIKLVRITAYTILTWEYVMTIWRSVVVIIINY